MAEFTVNGRMLVRTFKTQFKNAFGASLRVYKGKKYADDSATLASIRTGDVKGGDLKVNGNMQVGNFENKFKEMFGINIQVANSDDTALADNHITISAAGKQ